MAAPARTARNLTRRLSPAPQYTTPIPLSPRRLHNRNLTTGAISRGPRQSCLSSDHRKTLRPGRTYHSTSHPAAPEFSPEESAILSSALCHVPHQGFSDGAIALGARDAGYLDISASALPEGPFRLVRWHLAAQRTALASKRSAVFAEFDQTIGGGGLGRKVELLTWARLLGNAQVIGRWQDALALMAQPRYMSPSLSELACLSDEIWYLAGDSSVDPSWYTKRATLSAIYASTELFMTHDRSAGFAETRGFLRRRIAESNKMGDAVRSIGQWVGFTASAAVNVLRSKGMLV